MPNKKFSAFMTYNTADSEKFIIEIDEYVSNPATFLVLMDMQILHGNVET